MQYLVRALDTAQQLQTVMLDALDEVDARQQAQARLLTPLSVSRTRPLARRRDTRFPLQLFAQELLALLSAGLGVVEALDTLIEKDEQHSRRAVLERLARGLREGQRLSSALRQQPAVFPPLFVGVVQAAEGTSDLPRALARYLAYETRLDAVRHKVVSAAVYPAILLTVGCAVSLFLLGYVVPRFATVYQGSQRSLPWASEVLLGWGQFVAAHSVAVGVAALLALGVVAWQLRRLGVGGWWRVLRVLPYARHRLDLLELSRLYLTLGMLIEGGIPVPTAMDLARPVLPEDTAPGLDAARLSVAAGQSLSASLESHRLSTPVALRLLRVGEQSGQLGAMLTRTAAFHDDETTRWIERFTKAFEPVLMAAIGIVIGLIVILLYLPIFELAGSLQ